MIETDNNLEGIIAARAYEIYQGRGGYPGREVEDWLEAERDVLSSLSAAKEVGITDAPAKPKRTRKAAAKSPAAATKSPAPAAPATRRRTKAKEAPETTAN